MKFKNITIEVPSWLSEEEVRRIVKEVIARLSGRISIEELREELNIGPGDLVEDLELYDVEKLKFKEKERLK